MCQCSNQKRNVGRATCIESRDAGYIIRKTPCTVLKTTMMLKKRALSLQQRRWHRMREMLNKIATAIKKIRQSKPARNRSRTRATRTERISSTTRSARRKHSTIPCGRGGWSRNRRPCCPSRTPWHSGRFTTLTWESTRRRCGGCSVDRTRVFGMPTLSAPAGGRAKPQRVHHAIIVLGWVACHSHVSCRVSLHGSVALRVRRVAPRLRSTTLRM